MLAGKDFPFILFMELHCTKGFWRPPELLWLFPHGLLSRFLQLLTHSLTYGSNGKNSASSLQCTRASRGKNMVKEQDFWRPGQFLFLFIKKLYTATINFYSVFAWCSILITYQAVCTCQFRKHFTQDSTLQGNSQQRTRKLRTSVYVCFNYFPFTSDWKSDRWYTIPHAYTGPAYFHHIRNCCHCYSCWWLPQTELRIPVQGQLAV